MNNTYHLCYNRGWFCKTSDIYYSKNSVVIYNVSEHVIILRYERALYADAVNTWYYDDLFDSVEIIKEYEDQCSTLRLKRDMRRLQRQNPLWYYFAL